MTTVKNHESSGAGFRMRRHLPWVLLFAGTFGYILYSVVTHDPRLDIRAPEVQDRGVVAYAPHDPDLSYLLHEWPLANLRVVTATVTGVVVRRIPKMRRFAFERDTGARVFSYEVDGQGYQGEEFIGPAGADEVGRSVTAVVRRDDPSQARLVDLASVQEALSIIRELE